jgi:hypothetical protein
MAGIPLENLMKNMLAIYNTLCYNEEVVERMLGISLLR